jgi:hypothetical protein
MKNMGKWITTLVCFGVACAALSASGHAKADCNNGESTAMINASNRNDHTQTDHTIVCSSSHCGTSYPGCGSSFLCCSGLYSGYSANLTVHAAYPTNDAGWTTVPNYTPAAGWGSGFGYYDAVTIWCADKNSYGWGMWNGLHYNQNTSSYANNPTAPPQDPTIFLGCPLSGQQPTYDSTHVVANAVLYTAAWGWVWGP